MTQVSALIRGCALVLGCAAAAEYPGTEWPAGSKDGWSASLLDAARNYTRARATSSVFIVQSGKVVDSWGDVALRIETQSVRKSFLSSLYGIHVAEGHVDLGKTVGELGITDKEPALTEKEKQATVLDLLRARSGVYHPVGLETAYMKATQPARGSYATGEHYYYNNWDFNVLGTLFEKSTGKRIFAEFAERIAEPIGMQDFRPMDGRYMARPDTIHPHYVFSVTARDMARFGYLYLRGGRWKDRQVVPAEWVRRSTMAYSTGLSNDIMPFHGYGFLWWVTDWGYAALGQGGHIIAVHPAKDLVIVHRVNNLEPRKDSVPYHDVDTLVRMIIAAAPAH